jgi:hypothetical protein
MERISAFLEKYTHLGLSRKFFQTEVVGIIKAETGIAIDPGALRRERTRLYIDVSPLLKGEIFLRKGEILKKVRALSSDIQEMI